uniref:Gfo/Idh/MocA family oxidoreductase n=1 Tax=Schlesneria paludicola TaxID=360056 RepID=A0A7C4LN13_9PLAN
MTATSVRVALVGCGRMGRHHGRLLSNDRRAMITVVCDPDVSAAERLRAELAPQAAVCPRVDELWSREDVDAVVICTPTLEHFGQVRTALERGWHVLCEKPLASNANELQILMADALQARARGQQCSVGYQRRHWSTFRTLRREVQSRRWGPVRAVSLHAAEAWQTTIAGTWRDDPRQNPGGFVGDAGSHKLDILFYVANLLPREVFARCWRRGSRVEIVMSASVVAADDVPVTLDFIGDAHHLGETWHFHCAEADLLVLQDRLWLARDQRLEPLPADEPQSEPVISFLDSICHGAAELAPPECAWPVFQLTQALLESSRTGRVILVA